MGIETGYQLVKDAFIGNMPFGLSWFTPCVIIILSLLLITRDTSKWKKLAFGVGVGWAIAGLYVPTWILAVLVALYVFEYISVEQIGTVLEATVTYAKTGVERGIKRREELREKIISHRRQAESWTKSEETRRKAERKQMFDKMKEQEYARKAKEIMMFGEKQRDDTYKKNSLGSSRNPNETFHTRILNYEGTEEIPYIDPIKKKRRKIIWPEQ